MRTDRSETIHPIPHAAQPVLFAKTHILASGLIGFLEESGNNGEVTRRSLHGKLTVAQ